MISVVIVNLIVDLEEEIVELNVANWMNDEDGRSGQ